VINDSKIRTAPPISDAVILMAGSGSRLRVNGANLTKPLTPVLGRPLISRILETLARAGMTNLCAVLGFDSESVMEQMRPFIPRQLNVRFVRNAEWDKQNGISVLAAAGHIASPFLLTMSDHLFDQSIVDLLLCNGDFGQLNLAVDRKLETVFDLNDATKVQTQGDRIVAIGKELQHYDAIDTGLFVCSRDIFDYLERAKRRGDCSLSDGVRLMAADRKARAIDIGQGWWQDIDTPEMLAQAERHLRERAPLTEQILTDS
jgi:1L-myo-inositol 1-phosphate cytidylyltransferase